MKDTVDLYFMSVENKFLACCKRGMYPFNINPLDNPEVLRSAHDNVWLKRNVVLQRRGITHDAIPQSETNLLEIGSGHLAGGVNATEGLAQTMQDLNHMNATTANIFKLAELAKTTAAWRMRHNLQDSALTPKEFQRRYMAAPRLTFNVIFGTGDGILGDYARDNAICRQNVRLEKDAAASMKKKKELSKLVGEYNKLKIDMSKADFKWIIAKLNIAIRCKTLPDDKAMPTQKEALLEHWRKIKGRQTPQPSPISSNDKGSVDDNAFDIDGNDEVALEHGVAHAAHGVLFL